MTIQILSRKDLIAKVKEKPDTYNAIIINEPGNLKEVEESFQFCKSYFYIEFWDTYSAGKDAPKIEDVSKILKWAEDKDDILVSCRLGVSRSSAIAYLIEMTRSDNAINLIDVTKHNPNLLILRHGSKLLEKNVTQPLIDLFAEKHPGSLYQQRIYAYDLKAFKG